MPAAVFQGIGVTELLIVFGIVLLVFGPKRLPMLGRQLGSSMREFKDGISRKAREDEEEQEERPALEAATARPADAAGAPADAARAPVAEDPAADRDR